MFETGSYVKIIPKSLLANTYPSFNNKIFKVQKNYMDGNTFSYIVIHPESNGGSVHGLDYLYVDYSFTEIGPPIERVASFTDLP